MPKFAANLSLMFKEVDFLDRFKAAADAGFKAVEFLFPYEYSAAKLKEKLDNNQLEQVLFNTSPGKSERGEWGLTALPGREKEAQQDIDLALEYAIALKCRRVHVMAGVVPENAKRAHYEETFIHNLHYAAEQFARHSIQVVIEALSPQVKPNYLFSSQYEALAFIERVNHPNVGIQFDFFHAQLVDGNITEFLTNHMDAIKHMQVASVPYRHEPDSGELNLPWLFDHVDALNYNGWIGCEYHPKGQTKEGLAWFQKYQS